MKLVVTTTYHKIKNLDHILTALEAGGWSKEQTEQLKADSYVRIESKHPDFPKNDQRVETTIMLDRFPKPGEK